MLGGEVMVGTIQPNHSTAKLQSVTMARRLAAAMSLIVFAVCLLAGLSAGNPPATILYKALVAMLGTLVVGLLVGVMAQKMLDENLKALKPPETQPEPPETGDHKNRPAKEAKTARRDR
jgi:peptidoglycan/LPS O-acetylase OafA/YrhL